MARTVAPDAGRMARADHLGSAGAAVSLPWSGSGDRHSDVGSRRKWRRRRVLARRRREEDRAFSILVQVFRPEGTGIIARAMMITSPVRWRCSRPHGSGARWGRSRLRSSPLQGRPAPRSACRWLRRAAPPGRCRQGLRRRSPGRPRSVRAVRESPPGRCSAESACTDMSTSSPVPAATMRSPAALAHSAVTGEPASTSCSAARLPSMSISTRVPVGVPTHSTPGSAPKARLCRDQARICSRHSSGSRIARARARRGLWPARG